MTQRKPEQSLNDRIREAIRDLDPVRVENAVGPGTPDINYLGGWIESKQVEAWPKRASTPLRIDHYTAQQRSWHCKRRRAGGRVHLVLEVRENNSFLIFDAATAAMGLGHWTQQQCCQRAHWMCSPWSPRAFRNFFVTSDSDRLAF